jgi:arsenate reductase
MYPKILHYIQTLEKEFDSIPESRKKILLKISEYVSVKLQNNQFVQLMYVCTHNSRRSHFGQIWSKVAADYYRINKVSTFSGGTEVTAFNINAINALKRAGFNVKAKNDEKNTLYDVFYSDQFNPISCFSKLHSAESNPQQNYAVVMTCSEAEENCPFIAGAELRIATTYHDPKNFDHTPIQDQMYDERCRQIALENLYVFFHVKDSSQ